MHYTPTLGMQVLRREKFTGAKIPGEVGGCSITEHYIPQLRLHAAEMGGQSTFILNIIFVSNIFFIILTYFFFWPFHLLAVVALPAGLTIV